MATNEDNLPKSNQTHLMTAREAAGYLRISLITLYRFQKRGLLTPLRTPGGHRRYTLQMLNDCLLVSDPNAKDV